MSILEQTLAYTRKSHWPKRSDSLNAHIVTNWTNDTQTHSQMKEIDDRHSQCKIPTAGDMCACLRTVTPTILRCTNRQYFVEVLYRYLVFFMRSVFLKFFAVSINFQTPFFIHFEFQFECKCLSTHIKCIRCVKLKQ